MTNNNHEVIFAIVNSGFAEDLMDVARELGVRGGTILHARGVASGPMTSGFILPFAVGACVALQGGEAVLRDAFGVVALVAMIPLITIQLLGFKGILDAHVQERKAMKRILDADDQQIINFM